MEYNTQCSQCGSKLFKRKSDLKRYNNFFCDKTCRSEFYKGQVEFGSCKKCGKKIEITAQKRKNSKTGLYFCGNQCKNEYIAQNNRWDGSPDCHRTRRPKIIAAANGECQSCGYSEDERMFDIHHNNGDHSDNSWSNLRCVCSWCHQKHHRGVQTLDLPPLIED